MTELRLVADSNTESSISSKQDESSTYSVTAIGSCRIVGPLRHLQQSEPMILNQSGVYGYSHSCTEVRKHLTHLLKGTRPPNELLPILSPPIIFLLHISMLTGVTENSSKSEQAI